jgi:predicted acylesterase/phospholipase RssA
MTDHQPRPDADYPADKVGRILDCDLIMKGGVTSGIVYPGAIGAITQRYRLRNIGGTSAGAIAAVAAAAMEYGLRSGGNPEAREEMMWLSRQTAIPTSLGRSFLHALFEAEPATAPIMQLLLPGKAGRLGPALALAGPALAGWLALVLAAGVAVALAFALGPRQWTLPAAALAGVLTGLALGLASIGSVLRRLLGRLAGAIVDNGLGLMTGKTASGARADGVAVPGLTPWLHETVQKLAGRSGGTAQDVLTFGDLWTVDSGKAPHARDQRDIDLVLVCSDINRLESVSFPFLPENHRLFYDPVAWARLFPADVLEAMAPNSWTISAKGMPSGLGYTAAEVRAAAAELGELGQRLRLLPKGKDLPIIVGARASMAFPGLFTPLPLWLLRWVGQPEVPDERRPILSPLYLSDGGITSNFPIHLFDGAVPTRPTFALNLLYPGDDLSIEEYRDLDALASRAVPGNVRTLGGTDEAVGDATLTDLIMPFANSDRVRFYKAPAAGDPVAQLAGLAMRVVETARTWADVSHFDQTGTRDRIIHIRLTGAEGGFNLDMDTATIESIDNKGSMAGTVLASRFDPRGASDPLEQLEPGEESRFELNWNNHRRVRLTSFAAAQDLISGRFHDCWHPRPPFNMQISTPFSRDLLKPGNHFQIVAGRIDAVGAVPIPVPDPLDRVWRPVSVLRLRLAGSDPRAIVRAVSPEPPAATD